MAVIGQSLTQFLLLWTALLLCCRANEFVNSAASIGTESEDDDDILIEDEDESVVQGKNIFEPTHEWKVVEDGQAVPAGLHIRMNLQTGLKEAKLLEEEDNEVETREQPMNSKEVVDNVQEGGSGEASGLQQVKDLNLKECDDEANDNGQTEKCDSSGHSTRNFQADRRRAHYYGNSDRRGVVNKKTKVFSRQELSEMLKQLNDDSIDITKIPGITSSSPIREGEGGKESEAEKPESHNAEDFGSRTDLPFTFHRDVEIMLEHVQTLVDENSAIQEMLHALEDLEYYVHQIDNAKDLNVIGGLVPIVRLLNHTNPEVRGHAAHVVGAAAQSNPQVQRETLQYGGLSLLCQLIASNESEVVQRRGLFAVSALLRGNPQDQQIFVERCQGFKVLGAGYQERGNPVQLKAVTLLTDILHEQREEHHHIPAFLLHQILEYGWCDHVTTLIYRQQPAHVEKGLLAMEAVKNTCDFTSHSSQLHALVKQFRQDESDDFTASLLEHCTMLLNSIRKANREF